jgi:hypothetical protein
MIYIFDIDGTLADISHRLHLISQEPKNWDAFFSACGNDKPIEPVCAIARSLRLSGAITLMVSGRTDSIREMTRQWLDQYRIPCDGLYLRKYGDHRPDDIVKPELMADLEKEWFKGSIRAIFEDRASVVKAYRDLGYTVFQVAEGNF